MIHIACNIDANFIQHCAVTLVSLFDLSSTYKCNFLGADNKQ